MSVAPKPSLCTVFRKETGEKHPQSLEKKMQHLENYIAGNKELHPFVSLRADAFLQGHFSPTAHDYTINIPISKETMSDISSPGIVYYPGCQTLSTILYGGFRDIATAFIKLGNIMQDSGFYPSGDARIIGIVHSYPGEAIPEEYRVARVCIPVIPVNNQTERE